MSPPYPPAFAHAMAVLSAGVDKKMPTHQTMVYYDLLSDIPIDVLRVAIKQALIEHDFHTIPPVGLLRRLATDVLHGRVMTADEAWEQVRKAVGSFHLAGFDFAAWQAAEAAVTEPALSVARRIGWRQIAEGEPDVVRSTFVRLFADKAKEIRREQVLPAAMKAEAARLRQEFRSLAANAVRGIE